MIFLFVVWMNNGIVQERYYPTGSLSSCKKIVELLKIELPQVKAECK